MGRLITFVSCCLSICYLASWSLSFSIDLEKEKGKIRARVGHITDYAKREDELLKIAVEDREDVQKKLDDANQEIGRLKGEILEESGHRLVAVVRSRQEYLLELELFPWEYINPTSRRTRWWIICKTSGDPRDEFLKVVEEEYRLYDAWKEATLDSILSDFIDFMCKIYPDLSKGEKGPHHESDPDLLQTIELDDKLRPKLFKIMGLQYVEKNIAGMKAITSHKLSMKGSTRKFPTLSDADDLRCIFIYHAFKKNFDKKTKFEKSTIQPIFPTMNEEDIKSVDFVKGDQVQEITVPGQQNKLVVKTVDKVKVEFADYHKAVEAYNENHGYIGKDKLRLILDSCSGGST